MISKVSAPPPAATPKASQRARCSPCRTPPSSTSARPERSTSQSASGTPGHADLVVAGAQRRSPRLDRAAARAPLLKRGGDARLGGAVAQQPFARRVREDLPLGIDDDGRDRASCRSCRPWIRSSSSERLDRRSEPPSTAPTRPSGANTGIVRITIGSPETRDDGDAVDHRPLVAQGVLEVVAVGDVGAGLRVPLVVADRQHRAVEADDEDAREERRQHRLALQKVVQAAGESRAPPDGSCKADAAQGALQADQPLRDRRGQPLRVVFLRLENDLLGAAADFAQHEDHRQRHARQDQHRTGQRRGGPSANRS